MKLLRVAYPAAEQDVLRKLIAKRIAVIAHIQSRYTTGDIRRV
jgi:hypothetical protein